MTPGKDHFLAAGACLVIAALLGGCDGQQITKVSLGSGPADSQHVLVELSSGKNGTLCFGDMTNVAQAVCTVILGRSKGITAVVKRTLVPPHNRAVAALDGCRDYKPEQNGGWNLNDACTVVTNGIPSECQSRKEGLECGVLVELLKNSDGKPYEGLVKTSLGGTFGTVCAKNVGFNEADAICRALGISTKNAMPLIRLFNATGQTPSIESLKCSPGSELAKCDWKPAASAACLSPMNQLSVSCPPDPPTPKPWPSPQLTCNREGARVCFQKSTLTANVSVDMELINATSCSVVIHPTDDSECMQLGGYANCSELTGSTADYLEYKLVVRFKGETEDGRYIRPPLTFLMYCEMNLESLVTAPQVRPDVTAPTTVRSGRVKGNAVVEVYKKYESGQLSDPVTNGSVQVGSTVYAAAMLQNADRDALLVVKDCWIIDGTDTVYLVRNKCPNGSTRLVPVNETLVIVAFRVFQPRTPAGVMSLMCQTVVCRRTDQSRECSQSCGFADGEDIVVEVRSTSGSGADRPEHQVTPPASLSVTSGDVSEGNSAARLESALRWALIGALGSWRLASAAAV